MATTPKRLVGINLAVASTTQYTVPASTTTIVKNITLCNTTATDITVSMLLGGINILADYSVKAKDTVTIDLSTIMATTHTISTSASAVGVHCTVSGVEVV